MARRIKLRTKNPQDLNKAWDFDRETPIIAMHLAERAVMPASIELFGKRFGFQSLRQKQDASRILKQIVRTSTPRLKKKGKTTTRATPDYAELVNRLETILGSPKKALALLQIQDEATQKLAEKLENASKTTKYFFTDFEGDED